MADDWSRLLFGVRLLDRLDRAAALYVARRSDGYVLTREPGAYGDQGGALVIPI